MKNLICNAFAFKEDYLTSMQMGGTADSRLLDTYMKNIFVSLKSAQLHNPEDQVMLVTNCQIPVDYADLFARHRISVLVIPFDSFVMPKEFVWSLAYFKLCALQYVSSRMEYEKILLMDADTVTMHSYEELWMEAEHGLMLFPVGHAYRHKDRNAIRDDYQRLYPGGDGNIVHYGGEFVCGRREKIQEFVKSCQQVYNTIQSRDFGISKQAGDETVLSIAAALMPVIEAGAYIDRYWTDEFYLVSTNTISNPVVIWHIPNEKKDGFLCLYRYFEKHGRFPDAAKTAHIMGIVRAGRPYNTSTLRKKILGKWRMFRS